MTEVPSCDQQAISPRRLLVRTMGRESVVARRASFIALLEGTRLSAATLRHHSIFELPIPQIHFSLPQKVAAFCVTEP